MRRIILSRRMSDTPLYLLCSDRSLRQKKKIEVFKTYVWPNPVYPGQGQEAKIRVEIPGSASETVEVEVKIYNIAAELVWSGSKRIRKGTEGQDIVWDVKNDKDQPVAGGIYIYVLTGPGIEKNNIKKIAVIK